MPWDKYIEIVGAVLDVHGTITVVTGASVEQVVRAFGGDPDRPESLSELEAEELNGDLSEFSMAVLSATAAGGEPAVIVIEALGFQGMERRVLEQASVNGRAASFHQNAKGLTNLAFAASGRVLMSDEFFGSLEDADPAVEAVLQGLDFEDSEDHSEKCLYAMERFTGCGITSADLEQIRSADVGYRVPE